ncbi:MAG TPA: porin family protein [Flavobacterium sp.]|nr:porin family protein [Flavobacterium sp.]
MKNVLFSLVALVSFGLANAQIKEKGTIEITPKIGTSSFTEYDEDGNSTKFNSGVELGATVDYYFNDRWSLRSGLIFDKMGGKYDVGDPYLWEDKLNYMTVPINANWHFGSTRKWNLNFGLSPSFLLSAKINDEEIPSNTIESFQLGLSFGIGYKIEVTKRFGILVDAQWFNGLTNINNMPESGEITNGGYSFNLGGVIQL